MLYQTKHALRWRWIIPSRGWLLVALGILGLTLLSKKGLYQLDTDEWLWMAQHSSTVGSINMHSISY